MAFDNTAFKGLVGRLSRSIGSNDPHNLAPAAVILSIASACYPKSKYAVPIQPPRIPTSEVWAATERFVDYRIGTVDSLFRSIWGVTVSEYFQGSGSESPPEPTGRGGPPPPVPARNTAPSPPSRPAAAVPATPASYTSHSDARTGGDSLKNALIFALALALVVAIVAIMSLWWKWLREPTSMATRRTSAT